MHETGENAATIFQFGNTNNFCNGIDCPVSALQYASDLWRDFD
ncbi:hypothetical protein SFMTTN_3419 [Sulfuriferula multivorans]|uniref:Uncharacterized protein n=1 Tax=Sulfuriferula multivorans TaxID=1559896 RepID=A0A401JZT5_9PROT|nr:hypothetical protein SFMTTN_3419 [Sulfuriferula multivorans]